MSGTTDVLMPLELEGTTATVRSWLKQVGDPVRRDEPLVELETDKVTSEVPSPADGVLLEILLDRDAPAEAGALLGRVGERAFNTAKAARPFIRADSHPFATASPDQKRVPVSETGLSPAVRRALAQHEIDPSFVIGTGRKGRITRADVDRFVEHRRGAIPSGNGDTSAPVPVAPSAHPAEARSVPSSIGATRIVPLDRMRRAIAQNMVASVATAPHVTAVFEADFGAIMAHRARNKAAFEAGGVPLTYTAYLIAASIAAMGVSPAINSRWHDHGIATFDYVNIGIGTALGDQGLVLPVVHDAHTLSLLGIATRLRDITTRARSGTLRPTDMKDATFSISNHGVSGSLFAAPIIIPQPQSAILGVGKVEKRVVVRDVAGVDALQVRPMSYVSLTIDHRVIDGHQTNAWLSAFVGCLEGWPIDA